MKSKYWTTYFAYLNGSCPRKVSGKWWAWVYPTSYGDKILVYMNGFERSLFSKYGLCDKGLQDD
jgi:hypothetical protein